MWQACYLKITMTWSSQGTIGPGPCLLSPNPRSSWGDTIMVSGTGTVTRGPGVPQYTSDCNYSPCHSYGGGPQQISVTPLPATLSLTAYPTKVVAGTSVTFTASVSPFSIKNLQVPLKILSWRWLPDGGGTGQTVACATVVNPCSTSVKESGSMEVTALANGAEQVATAAITVWAAPGACPSAVMTVSPRPVTTQYGAIDASHPQRHTGRDYAVPVGTPIYAPVAGMVKDVETGRTSGKRVIVVSPDVNSYFFHLSSVVVTTNQTVVAGQLLGYTGNTGASTGPHLHFEQHTPGPIWLPSGKAPRATGIEPCTF